MKLPRPFLGIDGEGAGQDDRGRQLYRLICAGDSYNMAVAGAALSTETCLEFLLNLPARPILVGYYFNYDVTMIIRDFPKERIERLCEARDEYNRGSPYTWWNDYGIEWRPGHFFRVCRLDVNKKPIRRSARTVYDVSGHFRMPFLDALALYRVGTKAELRLVAAGKNRRGAVELDEKDLAYCRLECRLLAELMVRLRESCGQAECLPRTWDGAAKITNAMLAAHGIPKAVGRPIRRDVSRETHCYPAGRNGTDKAWLTAVMRAQFGGRIECRMIGDIPGPIWLYDLGSAYPSALLTLPCPLHTNWHKFKGEPRGWRWWLGVGRYRDGQPALAKAGVPLWGALPARREDQSILYPTSAEGAWWSPELAGLGERFIYRGGWGADRDCDCRLWDWITPAYDRRMRLGTEIGYPIKVALAAINGKLSQRRGIMAPYRDLPASGLLTSWVRRRLRDALDLAGEHGVMAMTDAVASTSRLPLRCGPGLGEWRESRIERLHIVGSGVYWSEADVRARSLGRSRIEALIPKAEAAWRTWIAGGLAPIGRPPEINVPMQVFISPRTAIDMAWHVEPGQWRHFDFPLSYDWRNKRDAAHIENGMLVTEPRREHIRSQPYKPEHLTETEKLMQLVEATE